MPWRILHDHPDVGFIWTGRTREPTIQRFFESRGVASSAILSDGVDTSLYSGALDIFLETFPFGCGVTGYQALGAGTALLSYLAENTVFGMQYGDSPKRSGNAFDPAQYR